MTGSIKKERPSSGKKNSKKSSGSGDLFGTLDVEVEGEGGLFGESSPPPVKEPVKKKKPAGAVSIFGPAGDDLFSKPVRLVFNICEVQFYISLIFRNLTVKAVKVTTWAEPQVAKILHPFNPRN